MTGTTHTPGPLEIVEAKTLDNSGQWHVYIAAPDGRKIAALWGGQSEKIGNARLFAAAQDMLAELKRLLKLYPHSETAAVIAKAEGRES